jgi:hypothetical protein
MVNRSSDDTRSVCRGPYYSESFAIVRLEGPSARLKVSISALNAMGRCGGRRGAEVGGGTACTKRLFYHDGRERSCRKAIQLAGDHVNTVALKGLMRVFWRQARARRRDEACLRRAEYVFDLRATSSHKCTVISRQRRG